MTSKEYTVEDVAKVSLFEFTLLCLIVLQHSKEGDLWIIIDCMRIITSPL